MNPVIDPVTFLRLTIHMRRYLELLSDTDTPCFGVLYDYRHPFEFRYCWKVLNSEN
jgi:hypothetical protein